MLFLYFIVTKKINIMVKRKLTPAQEKFIEKFLGKDLSETETTVISNRFSGNPSVVNLKFAAAYNFVMQMESAMSRRSEAALQKIHPDLKLSNAIQNFDRARMLALSLDSEAYMNLLD
jgi:hypothetical protein